MADVRCEHLLRRFSPDALALDDVSLEVAHGELLVLVGPSGCGKSTLLRIVAGLETADSGTVRIGGRDVGALPPAERNVAMVFQDYALYPHMTVRRNLEFPLRVRREPAAERAQKVARIAAMLDLERLLERLPRELSGGQRQRVAMGRALVREPAVSLLDEPLSNLDAKLRSEVRAEIADLQHRTGTTMLYVTHDQVEAMTLGQRVAVLDRGRLQQVAPPDELYERPANAFVAGFLGNPPMNLLPIERLHDGRAVVAGTSASVMLDGPVGHRVDATTLGVRPEALRLDDSDSASGWGATVEHVELVGHETLVHASIGEGDAAVRVVARVDGTHRLVHGRRVGLVADPARIHFFAADGRRL